MLCIGAGLVGLALGFAGAYLEARAAEWQMIVEPGTAALALAASIGVGVVFGYLPARRATEFNPIDALRRE